MCLCVGDSREKFRMVQSYSHHKKTLSEPDKVRGGVGFLYNLLDADVREASFFEEHIEVRNGCCC